ncbi:MAG: hypothetical protein CVU56_21075 [Deltaproteobacteria bacterium HGW-Deltaproteobacteria-14]|nr:MAG: hypothetical protein CVU56_21075 [Deltaproteobacteria bacterium HGW-Deltaproteobacteria-14]
MSGPRWIEALVIALTLVVGGCGGDAGVAGGADIGGSIFPDTSAPADTASGVDAADTAVAADTAAPDGADAVDDDAGADAGADLDGDAATADAAVADAVADSAGPSDTTADTAPPSIADRCFSGLAGGAPTDLVGPDYDHIPGLVAGSHCFGTNHQDITDVERVVFLGDSMTVGTPNEEHLLSITNSHFYRNRLAEWLADAFALDRGEPVVSWGLWKSYDYATGKGGLRESGDFANCAKWGARTDDFLAGGDQIGECFPDGGSAARTLIVFTMGGNDLAAITQRGGEASADEAESGYPSVWALAESAVAYLEEAIVWLKSAEHFPNGSYVVFGNPYEFTDSTGRTDSCTPRASLTIPGVGELDLSTLGLSVGSIAGFQEWAHPEVQAAIVVWIMNEYARIVAEHQVDMVWALERFCGHGYIATGPDADPNNRCYLGPDAELWFDVSCIHPNAAGHNALFEMFRAVVEE